MRLPLLLALLVGAGAQHAQQPLQPPHVAVAPATQRLKGRFLHITDLHPDPFYKPYSSTAEDDDCHRGRGPAGYYGAETTDCDSPLALVNATFAWIAAHLRDEIDFVVWTGDSARHDSDEEIPRDEAQVTALNRQMVDRFRDAFGADWPVPIVPTFGNNDILPHNVFFPGPNAWTRAYLDIWRPFIPEAQRHTFAESGAFFVEVIPGQLAVFSLNSLHFFDKNPAVDGCAARDEPGYQQFEWLRVQLQFLRRRGVKAILTGHVPPAHTPSKQMWDETCWQKYTLWLRQYRDVVVASAWGHMNIDHFLLQDHDEIDTDQLYRDVEEREPAAEDDDSDPGDEGDNDDDDKDDLDEVGGVANNELTIAASADYLDDLRLQWAALPRPPKGMDKPTKKGKRKRARYLRRIGGEWAERFSLSLVSPSVVPNYHPTLRILHYNTTGVHAVHDSQTNQPAAFGSIDDAWDASASTTAYKMPKGPSKSAPPGPAYSPQSLTLLRYEQLFANLTVLNNDFTTTATDGDQHAQKWHSGIHADDPLPGQPEPTPHPRPFAFACEYDTAADPVYALPDLTVGAVLELAQRLGRYVPPADDADMRDGTDGETIPESEGVNTGKHGARNRPWLTFARRAYVGVREVEGWPDIPDSQSHGSSMERQ